MPISVDSLVAAPELGVGRLVDGRDAAVTWVHSSDLVDPTPFLGPGQVLLTTGTQLTGRLADTRAYVTRLTEVGVAALGLGTGLGLDTPPDDLVVACEGHALPLFEVPYRVPFLAIARWVADALTAEATARDAWSVKAQRTISLAALSPRRLDGVLDELARQLSGRVLLVDAHGALVGRHGAARPAGLDEASVRAEARRLLHRNARAGGAQEGPGWTVALQTLGRRDHLRGVLATVTAAPPDAAATAVITGAVALTELALEDRARAEAQQSSINAQLLRLLAVGEVAAVREVVGASARRLPESPVRVLVCRAAPGDVSDLTAAVVGRAEGERAAVLAAPDGDRSVFVVPDPWWSVAAEVCEAVGVPVGVSGRTGWDGFAAALAAAHAALGRTRPDRMIMTADAEQLLGLLPRGEVADLARQRLRPVLLDPEGLDLVQTAEAWLRHNALYDRAARDLGVHRHTIKAKVQRVADLLDLDLSTFAGKAELWALLASR